MPSQEANSVLIANCYREHVACPRGPRSHAQLLWNVCDLQGKFTFTSLPLTNVCDLQDKVTFICLPLISELYNADVVFFVKSTQSAVDFEIWCEGIVQQ